MRLDHVKGRISDRQPIDIINAKLDTSDTLSVTTRHLDQLVCAIDTHYTPRCHPPDEVDCDRPGPQLASSTSTPATSRSRR